MLSRSYGKRSIIVKRGPQSVQVMKKYPYLGSLGSRSSVRHWLHMAMSGGITEPECLAISELLIMANFLCSFLSGKVCTVRL